MDPTLLMKMVRFGRSGKGDAGDSGNGSIQILYSGKSSGWKCVFRRNRRIMFYTGMLMDPYSVLEEGSMVHFQ